jgi:calcium-dependent protein kinase
MGACLASAHVAKYADTTVVITHTDKESVNKFPEKNVKVGGIGHGQFILHKTGRVQDVYAMERQIGAGSYGSVCKGTHRVTKVVRAVKTLAKGKVRNVERFRREIAIMKVLDHPGVIKLFETFEDHRNIYLVMELCEGGELLDKIIASGHFTEAEAAHVLKQALRALYYIHQNGICHRDLKPENFLCQSKDPILSNIVKIIDFGLSHDFQPGGTMSTKAGTPFYVAPEVLKGSYTELCDVWSIGVIMYVLLCGYPPFTGKDKGEVLSKVQTGCVHFCARDWYGVSDAAVDLVKKLLMHDPQERLTAEQALKHEWIFKKAPAAPAAPLDENFVERLRQFRAQSKFMKAVLHVIAGQLSTARIRGLQDVFVSLDVNGDGFLSPAELRDGLQKAGVPLEDFDLDDIVYGVDADGSGAIDYTEFLAATLDQRQYIQEDVCWSAFGVFDLDGDGKIQRHELRKVLENGGSVSKLAESRSMELMWEEVDSNHDNSIDFDEFMAMMKSPRGSLASTAL